MKRIFFALCGAALCASPALAQNHHAAAATATAPLTDQQFVDLAAQTDMLEAHIGQLAADHASRQDVKDYAQMLVTDHTADYQQLGAIAAKDNLTIPKGLDDEHWKLAASLEKQNGAAFDAGFIRAMIDGHTKAIGIYTQEGSNAQNADVKSYASAATPTLQKHLDGAKDLQKKK